MDREISPWGFSAGFKPSGAYQPVAFKYHDPNPWPSSPRDMGENLSTKGGGPEAGPSVLIWRATESWELIRSMVRCPCPLLFGASFYPPHHSPKMRGADSNTRHLSRQTPALPLNGRGRDPSTFVKERQSFWPLLLEAASLQPRGKKDELASKQHSLVHRIWKTEVPFWRGEKIQHRPWLHQRKSPVTGVYSFQEPADLGKSTKHEAF